MGVIICPGVHDPELTQGFLAGMGDRLSEAMVFPAAHYPAYSPIHILDFIRRQLSNPLQAHVLQPMPLVFIAFSAGVVGAIGAAHGWQWMGGKVKALIALDGWGVPLYGNFPIHRVSHDCFTHRSSTLLGAGGDTFYADPSRSHLELWRSPQTVQGWWSTPSSPLSRFLGTPAPPPTRTTLSRFLLGLLTQYRE